MDVAELESKLLSTTDAQVWTEEFLKLVEMGVEVDFGLMIGWFSNAMVVAAAEAEQKAAKLAMAIRLTQEYLGDDILPRIAGWSWYDALTEYEGADAPPH